MKNEDINNIKSNNNYTEEDIEELRKKHFDEKDKFLLSNLETCEYKVKPTSTKVTSRDF